MMSLKLTRDKSKEKTKRKRPKLVLDPIGNYQHYHRHSRRNRKRKRKNVSDRSWWWIAFCIIVVFFVILPLIFFWPFGYSHYGHSSYHHHHAKDEIRGKGECTVGETFSDDLQMCAPILPFPQAWDRSIMKDEVPPCQGFFDHACGKWIDAHENENRAFTYIIRENDKQIKDIVTNPETLGVHEFYNSCVDTIVNGKHGKETEFQRNYMITRVLDPLVRHDDLPKAFALMAKQGYTIPFQLTIEDYPTKPELVPLFRFDGFDELDNNQEWVQSHFEEIYSIGPISRRKTELILKMSRAINFKRPKTIEHLYDYVDSGGLADDTLPFARFKELSSNFDWDLFLKELRKAINGNYDVEGDWLSFQDDQETWVMDFSYFSWFDPKEFTMEEWRTYIEFSILFHSTNFFPDLPEDAYFTKHDVTFEHSYSKLKKRTDSDQITETDCLRASNHLLPGLLSKRFLEAHFPEAEEIRSKVIEIGENIRNRFADLISETEWMDEETKETAVKKIRDIIVRAVHPTQWTPEPFASQVASDRYLRNLDLIRGYRVSRNLLLWKESDGGSRFDRDAISKFAGPLSTVNAWYSPMTSTITIFPGILRRPFFDLRYVDASLYGSIGLVIAHELSHSMDDTGRRFDSNGSYKDWWSPSSKETFHKKAVCIIKEYRTPEGCESEDYGEQTLCEDIADIVGIRLAYEAFVSAQGVSTTKGNKEREISDDEKRLFFYTFAQNWCESYDQEHLCKRVQNDVHAIARYRVDVTLRQMEYFADAFSCQPGDKMIHSSQCKLYGK